MKSLYKSITGLALAAVMMLSFTSAHAQRGRGGFHGGMHIGIGGPRFGFGFGYYRPFYPRLGFYINTLPYGYYPFYYGPDLYYYWGGTFYRPYNDGYQIAAPPIGASVPKIPSNAHPITIDGVQYYEQNGVYYKEVVDEKGKKSYVVSGKDGVLTTDNGNMQQTEVPRVGDVVTELPDNCRKVTLSGKTYYVSADDIYYEEFTDANSNTSYRIASVPENFAPQPVQQQQQPVQQPAPAPQQKPAKTQPADTKPDDVYNQ